MEDRGGVIIFSRKGPMATVFSSIFTYGDESRINGNFLMSCVNWKERINFLERNKPNQTKKNTLSIMVRQELEWNGIPGEEQS